LADAFILTFAGGSDRDYMEEQPQDRYASRRAERRQVRILIQDLRHLIDSSQ
jgi:hypothetical protein